MDKDSYPQSKGNEWIYKINHIRDGVPPETKETLSRLMRSGYTRHEAIRRIGTAVVREMFDIEKTREPYDEDRYVR
ncbi:MAG: hypothetical protein U9R75_05495 [Candidatus Thermoplasmatota archaeon]|nr:hypothetical protein [Candidatus Thermoplasmatota archaeon]